ncbi:glycosyltransferase family 2 protein [Eubacterium oxidoreducens]|uniref:Glycosyltransferase involved in cell wall bisynthesis n=1 Tax=Eubacterium oxidoreducens TaxID=1732 RepID=A0A1G6AFG3_EUBOX|nr:glycosyltransferase [Eubacterium oxidoreducens]SDB06813.1 Glycosyltransferase involved in cell wall bisynthesis [Eubacterium oxidoreducens]
MVSVIIPVYNVEPYLEECVKSVLDNKEIPMEVLLLNNGSTDKSMEICERFGKEYESVVVYDLPAEYGLSEARNYGMDHAKGEYLLFVDSDDYIAKDMIRTLVEASQNGTVDLVECCYATVEETKDGERKIRYPQIATQKEREYLTKEEAIRYYLSKNMMTDNKMDVVVWNKLYSRRLIEKYGIRFRNNINSEDVYFTADVRNVMKSYCFVPEVKYFYRLRQGSIMRSKITRKRAVTYGCYEYCYDMFIDMFPEYRSNCAVSVVWHMFEILKLIRNNPDESLADIPELIRSNLIKRKEEWLRILPDKVTKKMVRKICKSVDACYKYLAWLEWKGKVLKHIKG